MTKIQATIHDLQNTLNQQYSIYTTHQDLHFGWLQSVMFQLKVYENNENESNNNNNNIKVHDTNQPKADAEEISNSQIIQQKNLLDSYKRQLRPNSSVVTDFIPNIDEYDSSLVLSPLTSSPLVPFYKNQNESEKVQTAKKKTSNKNIKSNNNNINNKTNQNNRNISHKKAAPHSPVNLPLGRSFTSPKFMDSPINDQNINTNNSFNSKNNNNSSSIGSNNSAISFLLTSPSVKFVDNDSLLSTSQSSFGSDSGCDNSGEEVSLDTSFSGNDRSDLYLCQTLPSKSHTPGTCTISGSFNELAQTATSFQAQWQEMVEEKKRSTLTPKIPGTLFEFDKIPDSYQITESDDLEEGEGDTFFSSSENDSEDLHDDSLFEVHGKMIPIWARKENVEKFLKKQQKMKPDEIFANMTKRCFVSQIFGVERRPSLAVETTWDESDGCDGCDELIMA